MGTFIFDPLTDEVTILATNRAKRADQTGVVGKDAKEAKAKPEKTDKITSIKESPPKETGKKKSKVDFFAKGKLGYIRYAMYYINPIIKGSSWEFIVIVFLLLIKR